MAGWRLLPLLPLLSSLLLVLPAAAQTRDGGALAREFDALYAEIVGPGSLDVSQEANSDKMERLRELLPAGDALRDARFRAVYCGSNRWTDFEALLAYSREALDRAQAVEDRATQSRALTCTAGALLHLQGPSQGLAELDRAVAVLEGTADPQLLGETLMLRGTLLSEVGDQAKALQDFQHARSAFRDAGLGHEVDALLLRLAVTYRRIGDWARAEQYFLELLARLEERKDWARATNALIQLGYLHEESGAYEKAEPAFERAIEIATRHGYGDRAGSARLGLATVRVKQGRQDDALAMLDQARAGFSEAGIARLDDSVLLLTGRALAGKGRHREALANYWQALPLMQRNGNERYLATLYQAMATSEEALGRHADALAHFKLYSELQTGLQRKMQFQQNQLAAYEHEVRTRELENSQLRDEAEAQREQVAMLERVRNWQRAALLLGLLLIAVLVLMVVHQRRHSLQMRTLAMTDPLTGTASRIDIEKTADRALARMARSGAPMSVLALDLDYFKAVNDRYGHTAGDAVLRAAAATWQAQLRDYDALGRMGGEEFLVVCADTSLATAHTVAERLLEATRALRLPEIDPQLLVRVSIGVAEARKDETRDALFARADEALYRAKSLGRDRVES